MLAAGDRSVGEITGQGDEKQDEGSDQADAATPSIEIGETGEDRTRPGALASVTKVSEDEGAQQREETRAPARTEGRGADGHADHAARAPVRSDATRGCTRRAKSAYLMCTVCSWVPALKTISSSRVSASSTHTGMP